MNEKIREIAARVREMRELSEISAARMAQLVDVPHDVYLSYEQGEADIPASILYGIAQQLNVDMALLLTGDAPRMRIYSVTRKGEGVPVERRSQYRYQNLANNFAGKKAELFLVTVEPKPVGTPLSPNAHPGQEFNYLLEGSLKVLINNREIILDEGDSIFFDSSYPHAMATLDDRPAKFLAIIM
jgi:quercetin dioxygenase-like cupin family protein